ncbi:MAG: GGDEF domain-containing protein [Alphaproteobacteria bacterium]|nr:GGDEF domain-containing protein [Alphaproteobacteria bacterium]
MKASGEKIQEALETVQHLMKEAVRIEQLRDQLTGLPNDLALSERLAEAVERYVQQSRRFWVGFVEIDRFKRLNDAFGYQNADKLLQKVATHMEIAARDYFAGRLVVAFRAHGDEFFFLGDIEEDEPETIFADIHGSLEHFRESIKRVEIRVSGMRETMRCTVSIGWAVGDDAPDTPTARRIRILLEEAVNYAKRKGRDQVVRYSAEVEKSVVHSIRDHCPSCESHFSADIPEEKVLKDPLWCPNCGHRVDRPPSPPSPGVRQIQQISV